MYKRHWNEVLHVKDQLAFTPTENNIGIWKTYVHPRPRLRLPGNLWPSPQLQRACFLCNELETLVSSSALSPFEYMFVCRKESPGKTERVSAGWERLGAACCSSDLTPFSWGLFWVTRGADSHHVCGLQVEIHHLLWELHPWGH